MLITTVEAKLTLQDAPDYKLLVSRQQLQIIVGALNSGTHRKTFEEIDFAKALERLVELEPINQRM